MDGTRGPDLARGPDFADLCSSAYFVGGGGLKMCIPLSTYCKYKRMLAITNICISMSRGWQGRQMNTNHQWRQQRQCQQQEQQQ